MNDDRAISLIWILGALVLVMSALMHRGLSQRGTLKLALIWFAIIMAAWGAVTLIHASSA